jgi:5-methyltetrahydrofolate--homocysteine methyltransferase
MPEPLQTILRSATRQVIIARDRPAVIIGERINPTGKPRLAAALARGDMEPVVKLALRQVAEGADVLDINVGAAGVDEVTILPRAVAAVAAATDVPLCLDSPNPAALEAALAVCLGSTLPQRPLINSVNGEERSLSRILPLAAQAGAAVIALCMDDAGLPTGAAGRVAIARRLVERAVSAGLAPQDVLVDCLALTASAPDYTALHTLEAIRLVREELGVNLTLGASNISFGLPERGAVNAAFLAMAMQAGVNAPIADPAHAAILARIADLLLGHDEMGIAYVRFVRKQQRLSGARSA